MAESILQKAILLIPPGADYIDMISGPAYLRQYIARGSKRVVEAMLSEGWELVVDKTTNCVLTDYTLDGQQYLAYHLTRTV